MIKIMKRKLPRFCLDTSLSRCLSFWPTVYDTVLKPHIWEVSDWSRFCFDEWPELLIHFLLINELVLQQIQQMTFFNVSSVVYSFVQRCLRHFLFLSLYLDLFQANRIRRGIFTFCMERFAVWVPECEVLQVLSDNQNQFGNIFSPLCSMMMAKQQP